MPEIKAIFFDNDGVLVDTEELYFQVTRKAMQSLGVDVDRAAHEFINMSQGRSTFDLALERGVSPEAIEKARQKRNEDYQEILKSATNLVIPGVEEALKELKEGRILAIVTSCRPDHFKTIHAQSGLLKYFDFIIGQGDYEKHKPHPEPYLKALERSGVSTDEALVVEDAARGVEAAVAAGLRCVAIPRGISSSGDFSNAWKSFKSLSEFAHFIKSYAKGT